MTVLALIIVMPLLTVLVIGYQGVCQQRDQALLVRAMRSQLQVSLAGCHQGLLDQFGLLAVQEAVLENGVFDALVPDGLDQIAEQSGRDWLNEPAVLMAQVSRTMSPRLLIRLGETVFPSAGESMLMSKIGEGDIAVETDTMRADSLPEVPEMSVDPFLATAADLLEGPLSSELDNLQNKLVETLLGLFATELEPLIEGKLSDLWTELDDLMDMRQQVAGINSASLSIGAGDVLSDSVTGLAWVSQALSRADDWREQLDSPVTRQVLLSEYSLNYLTRAVFVRLEEIESQPIRSFSGTDLATLAAQRPAEIEQILTGLSAQEAVTFVRGQLTLIRCAIDLAAILQDSGQMARLRTTASSAAVLISAASGGSIILEPETLTYLLAVGEALRQGLSDVSELMAGQAVPFQMEAVLGIELSSTLNQLFEQGGYYQDYLRVFLWLLPQQLFLERLAQRISAIFPAPLATTVDFSVWYRLRSPIRNLAQTDKLTLSLSYAD